MPAKADSGQEERKVELKKEGIKKTEGDKSRLQARETPSGESRKPRAPRKPRAGKAEAKEAKETKHAPEKPGPAERVEPVLAVVMVRGLVGTTRQIRSTLSMLRLSRVNHCVLVPKNPNYEGMLQNVKHMITWGEIGRETLEKLVAKRGRFSGDKRLEDSAYAKELVDLMLSGKSAKEIGLKPVFRLSPPSKGYRSTKVLFPKGSLGYRGEKINELLKRMI